MADNWPDMAFDDLDSFGKEAVPEHAVVPGIETLANGEHNFEIVEANLKKIGNGDTLVEATLRVTQGGSSRHIRHSWWLNKQSAVNTFLAEMAALGFPAHEWGRDGVPLSKAIPECVSKLARIRFRGTKTSRQIDGMPAGMGKPATQTKTYHNLFISSRIGGQAMTPPQKEDQVARAQAGKTEEQIPF